MSRIALNKMHAEVSADPNVNLTITSGAKDRRYM